MNKPLLSIIIVCWNVSDLLRACLASLDADGVFDWAEIVVIDNASSDGSPEMVRSFFPRAVLITPGTNLGFARGNNLGIRNSAGEFVLLLNPDTEVHAGAMRALVDFAAKHPEYGAVGPKQYDGKGKVRLDGATELPTATNIFTDLTKITDIFPHWRFLPNRKFTAWDHEDARDVPAIAGSAMLIPRAVLERIGLLDETMFIIEDMDLCKRISDAGWKIHYLGTSSIVHLGGQSLNKRGNPDSYIQIAFQSFWLYLRKHRGRLAAARMVMLFMASSFFALALLTVLRLIGISARSAHYRTAKAILHWTVLDKANFSHDLAAPPRQVVSRGAEVAS